jgi:hypothetical protein
MSEEYSGSGGGVPEPPAAQPLEDMVPERQWELPVGFYEGGEKPVTLRELAEGSTPALLPAESLTDEQRMGLIIDRIKAQDAFELSVYGAGSIDKERAIHEVKAGSRVGNAIARVELMMIEEMVNIVTGKEPSPNS